VGILIAFFIGYTIVGVLALTSLLFGLALAEKYIALAGFVPLLAGIHKVYEALLEQGYLDRCCGENQGHNNHNSREREREEQEHRRNRTELIKNYNMVDSIDSSSGSDDDGFEVPPWNRRGGHHQHSHQNGSSKQKVMLSHPSPSGGRYEKQSNGTNIDSSEGSSPSSDDVEGGGFDEEFDISGQVEPPRYINERKCLGVFSWRVFMENVSNPLDWEVLMLTLASGSDHVVIYNAMLEDETSMTQILISIAVYYIMLVVHVVAAIALIRCKFIAKLFQTYSILFIIFLLIGTGIYILKDSVLFCNC
jgi:cadmium resistance protein CadD (predicted permease)